MNNENYFQKINSTSSSLFDIALGHKKSNERYTDMEQIGSGAIKNIHRVLDLTSGRPVALATPKSELSKEQIQFFLEEARLTASLQHPNIIQVYDLGFNQEGNPYFTMKLGNTLKLSDLLKDSSTTLFQFMNIYLKVCDAIAYAHTAGAIHRDLKPENILLGNFSEVLVCDWGSGQIIPGSNLELEVGQLSKPLTKGSLGYMSPEQVKGAPPHIAQDIYALGALLFNILTGQVASTDSHKKPSSIKSDIPTGLEAICLKAMAVNQQERYPRAELLIKDIKAWLSGFAPTAEQASIQKHLKLFISRHKTLSISIAASLAIISSISIFYINSLREKELQTRIQRDRAERALKLYDLEKESRQKIAKLGTNYFIDQANQLVTAMKRDMAKELLDNIPGDTLTENQVKKINAVYGRIYIYKQRFHEALKHLQNAVGKESKFLLSIAQDYALIKQNDDDMLSSEDTVKILGRLNDYDIHQAHCFYRDQVLRIPDYKGQIKLIEKMIFVNNEWMDKVNMKLTIEDGDYHLDLSNNPTMARWIPIREMPLHSLDLSNNPRLRNEFSVLYNMPLEELNISKSKIEDYSFLRHLPHLNTLIVDGQQAQSQEIKAIANRVKLITKK